MKSNDDLVPTLRTQKYLGTQLYLGLAYAAAALGAQRFLAPSLYPYACMAALALSLAIIRRDTAKSNTLMLLALFLAVDNGAGFYEETPGFLRYPLYLISILVIVMHSRLLLDRVVFFGIWILGVLLISAYNTSEMNSAILSRDILIVLLCALVLCQSDKVLDRFRIDTILLFRCLLIFCVCEIANIAFFYNISETGYLSYTSTKSLLSAIVLISLSKDGPIRFSVCLVATAYVLMMYQSRMITASLILAVSIYLAWSVFKLKRRVVFSLVISVLVMLVAGSLVSLEAFKVVTSLTKALQEETILGIVRALDPVRYGEIHLLLERNFFNVLFGSGLGSGIYDEHGYFRFVSISDTAFSATELRTSYFYNFHDVWTDVGLRFGLLPLLVIMLPVLRSVVSGRIQESSSAMILIVLVLNAFFSTQGLVLTALFALSYRSDRNRALSATNPDSIPPPASNPQISRVAST